MSTMKRSRINALIRDAEAFLDRFQFKLPPFSTWTEDAWRTAGPQAREIVERRLGWDVTDFGTDDFDNVGLVLFAMRNGDPKALAAGTGKVYAEKVLIVNVDQYTPWHFHVRKTEDIINRGGGTLAVQLYNATDDEERADTDVTVSTDGVQRVVKPGETVYLEPGESITLVPYLFHQFWAVGERVMAGEVSAVNDDETDNHFLEEAERYMEIVEDEPALYPLCNEIPGIYQG